MNPNIQTSSPQAQSLSILQRFLIFLIELYQKWISPIYPPRCRFYPSCSEYTKQAIVKRGSVYGMSLGFLRILRCNPWGGSGVDHVPEGKSACKCNPTSKQP